MPSPLAVGIRTAQTIKRHHPKRLTIQLLPLPLG